MELSIPGITKTLQRTLNPRDVFVLNTPPLRFRSGELTFLMGSNGSGKSVLSKIVSQDMPSDSGYCEATWGSVDQSAVVARISMVRQSVSENLAEGLSVYENFVIFGKSHGLLNWLNPLKRNRSKIDKWLEVFPSLKGRGDDWVGGLSLGQRQSLSIVLSLQKAPHLLILDEFLSALDHKTSVLVQEEVERYVRENDCACMIVSHDLRTALEKAGRIIVLKQGEVIDDFTRTEQSKWSFVHLGNVIS
jgi:putative ABC transport system ATP-binding protein